MLGTTFDLIWRRLVRCVRAGSSKYLVVVLVCALYIPRIGESGERLLRLEKAISGLSWDIQGETFFYEPQKSLEGEIVLGTKELTSGDVTVLISQIVHSAVLTHSRDSISKADFALHSAGARVIPSLTSRTFELWPRGSASLLTGEGYAFGRAPETAMHHELHDGHCWPFAGKGGQLGVMLAAPAVLVEEVTVDHVAKEVTTSDLRSAPREMEVWGLVEGKMNGERIRSWREGGGSASYDSAVVYPPKMSKREYIRLASIKYDVHAPNNIQTFAVDPEIRNLDLTFRIVVLRVLSNWGMDEFTCLYRFRVHGKSQPVDADISEGSVLPFMFFILFPLALSFVCVVG